jgi:hypothetical protein
VGASLEDAEAAGPQACQGREENREAWQADPLGRNRQSCGTTQAQNGKSVERTAKKNAAFFKDKTHRTESGAMWDIPVASIRISYSMRKSSQEVACALKGTEVRPPSHCGDGTVSDTVNH